MKNVTLSGRPKLPSLERFFDKRLEGLKQIIGGARNYTKTDGGQYDVGDGVTRDYVADAYDNANRETSIHGFCSHFKTAEDFYNSQRFRDWVNRV